MRFTRQEDFLAWCFDEPHAGIHLLSVVPEPGGPVHGQVALEWGVPDLEYEGEGTRVFVWRLTCDAVRKLRLQGVWSSALESVLRPHQSDAPIAIRLSTPGDLTVECESVDVEEVGWRVVELPKVPYRDAYSFESTSSCTTVGDLSSALGLAADAEVLSFSGRSASAGDALATLREKSARAWRIGPQNDHELLALTPTFWSRPGYHATIHRRRASDDMWRRAWALPRVLPGVVRVESGTITVTPEDWAEVRFDAGIADHPLDPARQGRALEPDAS